jgi:glycosyltransferase involved in cell wall biosynthesis
VAPPLTWIESMGFGVPIITTNVRGADELVIKIPMVIFALHLMK